MGFGLQDHLLYDCVDLLGIFLYFAANYEHFFLDLNQKAILALTVLDLIGYSYLLGRDLGCLLLSDVKLILGCRQEAFMPTGKHGILPDVCLAITQTVSRL